MIATAKAAAGTASHRSERCGTTGAPAGKSARSAATPDQLYKFQLWQGVGADYLDVLFSRFSLCASSARRLLLRIPDSRTHLRSPVLLVDFHQPRQSESLIWISFGIFVAGFLAIAQFSFLGKLHPAGATPAAPAGHRQVSPRILAAASSPPPLPGSRLPSATPPSPAKIAVVGACVAGVYVLIGAILTQWLPEPKEGAVKEIEICA